MIIQSKPNTEKKVWERVLFFYVPQVVNYSNAIIKPVLPDKNISDK